MTKLISLPWSRSTGPLLTACLLSTASTAAWAQPIDQPAPPPVAPDPPAAEPPAPATPAPTTAEKLAVGEEGWLTLSGLLQFWAFGADQGTETVTTFRLRRAEIKAKGELVPDLLSYSLMIDPAKVLEFEPTTAEVLGQEPEPEEPGTVTVSQPVSSVAILQDVYLTVLGEYAEISAGQFKTPLSYEGYNSSSKLLFPERALVSKKYGDKRDIGIKVEKKFEHFFYQAGVYNGSGQNRLDDNNQKDVALRLEAYPIKPLMLGAVGYASLGQRDEPTTKDRIEADLRLEFAGALLQGEYMHGWDGAPGDRVEGHGFYVAGGYTFFERLQPLIRIGFLDSDLDDPEGETVAYEAGVNYYHKGHAAKLQLSYSAFDTDGADLRHELVLAAQLAF